MIHTVLVAEQSWAFKRLLKESMEEGQNRVVIWKDIDEQTFALFAEFVYTGGYTPPDGEIKATGSGIGCPYLIDSITDKPEQSSTKVKGSISKAVHEKKRTEFRDLVYGPPATSTTPPTPAHSLRSLEDNSPPDYSNDNFLDHARVYVLAELYGVEKLKFLALQKLHVDLSNSYPYGEAYYRDVTALIKYAYENTLRRVPKDELRMLVARYVADEVSKVVVRSEHCYDLLQAAGDLARDVIEATLENRD